MKKKVTHHQNPSQSFERRYVYDNQEIILEYDHLNRLLAKYTHSSLRTDDVLSVRVTNDGVSHKLAKASGDYFYLKDGQGTITQITNSNGEKIQKYTYSAFGKLLGIQDALGGEITQDPILNTSYTYTGREYDQESGLYYYRARYYDSSLGRFLTADPHFGELNRPSSFMSKYAYAENKPTSYIDSGGKRIVLLSLYGNYCGPYDNDKRDWSERTVDGADARCKEHDQTYVRAENYESDYRDSGNFFAPEMVLIEETAHYYYYRAVADAELILELSFNHNSWKNNNGHYDLKTFIAAKSIAAVFALKYYLLLTVGPSDFDAGTFTIDKYSMINSTMKMRLDRIGKMFGF